MQFKKKQKTSWVLQIFKNAIERKRKRSICEIFYLQTKYVVLIAYLIRKETWQNIIKQYDLQLLVIKIVRDNFVHNMKTCYFNFKESNLGY